MYKATWTGVGLGGGGGVVGRREIPSSVDVGEYEGCGNAG